MKTQKIIVGIAIMFVVQLLILNLASALTIDSISVSPNEISPGDSVSVSIGITNNADADITNVNGNINITNVPVKIVDISSAFVDELREDHDDTLTFDLQALSNAKAGIYSLPISINYIEDNKTLTANSIATITISSAPILDVQKQEGMLIKGQNNEVNIQITNKGISDVKFLEAEIGENGYNLLSPSIAYIGDIDSNDFQTTGFKIFIPANSLNTISIPVTITYNDVLNKEYTKSFNVDARAYSLQEAQSLGLVAKSKAGTYISIIVLLVVVYIVYRIIKRILRKRKEKEEAA